MAHIIDETVVPLTTTPPKIIHDEKSFYHFLECFAAPFTHAIYRGVPHEHFKLIPNIGRYRKGNEGELLDKIFEKRIIAQYKKNSRAYINYTCSELELLAVGQHHGLPTRLLDWSFNPLVAIFFAVELSRFEDEEEEAKHDSAIYIYLFEKQCYIERITEELMDYDVKELKLFKPSFYNERIARQNGVFTVHTYPWIEYEHDNIHKILIDGKYRRRLRKVIARMGIDESTMYPGLDGASKNIRWTHTNYY
jgi:type I restriction enzyme M protein